ncbi:hypothetical protein BT69DRAFT_1265793 [Atractiella rhizophila]|nr:hypothetical protein BT69DRAFT_1269656 [Atractiella rhizophila]KAH8920346.1 hypothetical protein BT69DRAFT_1265793 [Atractiella rhizophila]
MPYCCRRFFVSHGDLWKHLAMSRNHNWCSECNEDFNTSFDLREHKLNSNRHALCGICDIEFDNHDDLEYHQNVEHPVHCGIIFSSPDAYDDHCENQHVYCRQCQRFFSNHDNLKSHLRSFIHTKKTVRCLMAGCGAVFVSHAALVLHLEAGACASGITRPKVDRFIVEADKKNIVTNPNRKISTIGNKKSSLASYLANENAWNGRAYECYLCYREFYSLQPLRAHLASPRHADKIYRCLECKKGFTALSGLWQHVENGNCGVQSATKQAMAQLLDSIQRMVL